ncbi:hypothetical protein INR49_008373 [Caranx melampygus]|nr:hypothetical protein INR49_008373 [Caranx melampygus]
MYCTALCLRTIKKLQVFKVKALGSRPSKVSPGLLMCNTSVRGGRERSIRINLERSRTRGSRTQTANTTTLLQHGSFSFEPHGARERFMSAWVSVNNF